MVRRIDNNGLVLSLVKLNGKLELHFTVDATFTAQYTIHGTDLEDTVEMEYAREAATGQPVVSIGLEMFMEDVGGLLEVRFDGAIGSSLSFRYDGRDSGDIHTFDGPLAIEPPATLGCLQAQPSSDALLVGTQYFQRVTTRDAKSQTIEQETRNVKTQTVGTPVQHAGVQTKTRRVVNRSTQATSKTTAPKEEAMLFPTVVDLTEQNISSPSPSRANHALSRTTPEVAPTFTNAVATVFQTFNEPRDPYRQKRQAEPVADYRAYKHIFIEGYRNGDGKEEEGRLHVDLAHHVLLWESYDDYEGGAKLTLDRFDLPRCEVGHKRLKIAHHFGDHQLQLYQKKTRQVIFCMDYKGKEAKIYGNNMGNGDERFHFVGEERVQVVIDAIEDCLSFKAKYVAPRLK